MSETNQSTEAGSTKTEDLVLFSFGSLQLTKNHVIGAIGAMVLSSLLD